MIGTQHLEQSLVICCFFLCCRLSLNFSSRRVPSPTRPPPRCRDVQSFRQPDAGCCRPQRKSPGMEGSRGVERPRRDNGQPLAVDTTELNKRTSFASTTADSPLCCSLVIYNTKREKFVFFFTRDASRWGSLATARVDLPHGLTQHDFLPQRPALKKTQEKVPEVRQGRNTSHPHNFPCVWHFPQRRTPRLATELTG